MNNTVIAIIVLLILAGGGFYFLGQGAQEEGSERTEEQVATEEEADEEGEMETLDLSGIHIMADGSVMLGSGETLEEASVTAEGMIELPDGRIVEPVMDMREEGSMEDMNGTEPEAGADNDPADESNDTTDEAGMNGDSTDDTETQNHVFSLDAFNYGYSEDEIRVNEGDTVTINLTSTDGFHDWVVDAFDAQTERVSTGETDTVTFVAGEAGTYEFYCSVGNHRTQGMVGTLIVE